MVKHDGGDDEDGSSAGGTVVTAVYKVNLHCLQCAREIQKPLLRTQGVEIVDINMESSEIKVKGRVDPNKIHEQITRISKKKVEMVIIDHHQQQQQQQPKNDDDGRLVSKKKGDDQDAPIPKTTTLKVHLHCSKCEYDLKRKLLKLKGVHSVKTDSKAQTLTIDGTIDTHKLVEYIHKKVHKHAEIMTSKHDVVGGKKEKEKEIVMNNKLKKKITDDDQEKEEMNKLVRLKENSSTTNIVPAYIVMNYHVYAPQWFSDENPNACSIM